MSKSKSEHGPRDAGYNLLSQAAFGSPRPYMECLCGWITGRGHECWMTVGEEFDEHLAVEMPTEGEGPSTVSNAEMERKPR